MLQGLVMVEDGQLQVYLLVAMGQHLVRVMFRYVISCTIKHIENTYIIHINYIKILYIFLVTMFESRTFTSVTKCSN